MSKTIFSPGVIVTSEWLNGSQQLYFDGQVDLDWHYQPLTVLDIQRTNPSKTGFNDNYVTTGTAQTLASGQPIIGEKEFRSHVTLGIGTGTDVSNYTVAPKAPYPATTGFYSQLLADTDRDSLVVNWGLLNFRLGTLSISDLLTGCGVNPAAPTAADDGKYVAFDFTLGDWTCKDTVDGGDF